MTLTLLVCLLVQDTAQLLRDLESDDVAVRDAAAGKLEKSPESALPALREARQKAKDAELRGRLDRVVAAVEVAHPGKLKIAYTKGERLDGEIWMWEDGKERRITENKGMESRVSLSPDGTKLVYCLAGDKNPSDWDAYEIVVHDLATKKETKLGKGVCPMWSPDGKSIAAGAGKALVVLSPDGKERREIAKPADKVYKVMWSANGKKLAIEVDDNIVVLDAATGKEETTISGKPANTSGLYSFSWANDGKTFSMVSGNGPYFWDVYLTSIGGEPRKLTSTQFRHGISAISPDGSRILYCRSDGGGRTLHVIDVATGSETKLHDSATPLLAPVWSPDGKLFVFVTDDYEIRIGHPGAPVTKAIVTMKPLYGPAEMWYAPSVHFGK